MNLNITGKRAIVTGAGRGIGREIALSLAKEGVKIAIISRTEKELNETLKKIGGLENGHYAVCIDLTEDGSPKRVFEEIKEKFGIPNILINNLGGTLDIQDPFCSIEEWRNIYRLNLEIAIEFNNLVIPEMKKNKWGRIINISSISGSENQGPVPYCAVKSALNAYTRSMGRILSPDGIIMAAVSPGVIFTEGGYWDITTQKDPEYVRKYMEERMAIKRFGKPEEISSIVAFLCSEQASFCVGSVFVVDGGQGRGFF
ncbi:MAG: SDR family oxidoreductase [Nanoarchaeota archaeon]